MSIQAPVVYLNTSTQRQQGRQAQVANITAAKVADIIRTCLGAKGNAQDVIRSMGGIVLTNDGHAILRN